MLYIIIVVAVLAFLIALCFIFADNIKAYFKKIFSKKTKNVPKGEPLKEERPSQVKIEEFIPLKNQYDDSVRDASLEELFGSDDDYMVSSDQAFKESIPQSFGKSEIKTDNFDSLFRGHIKGRGKASKKPISEQIKDLSPELKMILIDSVLKKRDDV